MYKNFDYLRLIDNYKEYNNPFSHDFNIIFQSSPCQLLSEKMQLIPDPKHYNNRLSHSLDVCKIACLIVDYLNVIMEKNHIKLINKELIKAISFAHDIGHPPFGHTGERSLDQIMLKSGGFESNAQTLVGMKEYLKIQMLWIQPEQGFVMWLSEEDTILV